MDVTSILLSLAVVIVRCHFSHLLRHQQSMTAAAATRLVIRGITDTVAAIQLAIISCDNNTHRQSSTIHALYVYNADDLPVSFLASYCHKLSRNIVHLYLYCA
jgi:hypothetical protein